MWFIDLFTKKEKDTKTNSQSKATQTYNDTDISEITQYLEDVTIDTSPVIDIQAELDKRIGFAIYESGFHN